MQVDLRQAEIERLTTLLDGGRPHDVVALEARNRGNERLIAHLNIQVSNIYSVQLAYFIHSSSSLDIKALL